MEANRPRTVDGFSLYKPRCTECRGDGCDACAGTGKGDVQYAITEQKRGYLMDVDERENDDPMFTVAEQLDILQNAVMEEWGHNWQTQPAVRRVLGTRTYDRLAVAVLPGPPARRGHRGVR